MDLADLRRNVERRGSRGHIRGYLMGIMADDSSPIEPAVFRLLTAMWALSDASRGLDRSAIVYLSACDLIRNAQSVLITGPTSAGRTFIVCAMAHSACCHGFSARYYRVPRLLSELTIAHADGSYPKLLSRPSRIRPLVLDDWGTAPLGPSESRDILEIVGDRSQLSSTIIASQLPIEDWRASIIDPSVVIDRLVHNSHRICLKGESMRKVEQRPQRTIDQGT